MNSKILIKIKEYQVVKILLSSSVSVPSSVGNDWWKRQTIRLMRLLSYASFKHLQGIKSRYLKDDVEIRIQE